MQQELWLRAQSQVLSSIVPVCALRAAAAATHGSAQNSACTLRTADPIPQPIMSKSGPSPSNSYHAPTYPLPPPRTPNLGLRSRTLNSSHPQSFHHNRDNGVRGEFKSSSSLENLSGQSNPLKNSRTHQELHKELLLAHKKPRGLGLSSKPELHQVLERRKREQSQKEEGEQARTPLEEVLLKRQQKHLEREKRQEEQLKDEAQLLEFVRVRQNLRKIHTAFQKATISRTNTEDSEQND